MTRFIEKAIVAAGLGPVLEARRAGDLAALPTFTAALEGADLLVLGAIADLIRAEEVGDDVRIHVGAIDAAVVWAHAESGASESVTAPSSNRELGLLRKTAILRVFGAKGARIGVDWSKCGLELAQVALGFGASDLMGPITRKNGLLILDGESKKVKGQGLVDLASIKKREISALVRNAGREAVFTDEPRDASKTPARADHDSASSLPSARAEDAHV